MQERSRMIIRGQNAIEKYLFGKRKFENGFDERGYQQDGNRGSREKEKNKVRAILTYTVMIDGNPVEQTKLFDTTKAKKICDVVNTFGYKVQEIYITGKGVIFLHNTNKNILEMADQKQVMAWIGENEPDKYIEFFGDVEEG